MKAIILAGGEGSRLKSISGGIPKPMMPLLGKPLLEHIIALLKENGFDEICLTLRYRAADIQKHFGDGEDFGVKLDYRIESEPLGTAGSVKGCMDFVGGEDFLVIAGDCACDFSLRDAMAQHKGGATIVLSRSDEPLRYGLVVTGIGGFVTGFLEKPAWERVVTDMVSTGIYVLSSSVMDEVPENKEFDFAKDLFPRLLQKGETLRGVVLNGYWCDIGTPRAYYQCNLDALDGRLRLPSADGERRTVIPCRSRAVLMRKLCACSCEFGADFTDGLRLTTEYGTAHAAPLADQSAIVIEGEGECVRALEEVARRLENEV